MSASAPGSLDRVGVESETLELRQAFLQLALEPLRPGADPGQLDRAALGTGLGHRLDECAMVAVEELVPVEDERNVAVQAAAGLPTRSAVQRGRHPPAVEQQDRLPASASFPSEASSGAESG